MKAGAFGISVLVAVLSWSAAASSASSSASDADHTAIAQRLAALAGTWQVEQQFWSDPDAAPKVDQGEAVLQNVLGNRHLEQRLRIDATPVFEGRGFTGLDEATGHWYSSWMDTNFNGVLLLHGDFEASSNSLVFRGQMIQAAKPVAVREVLHFVDGDHFTVDYFEDHGGREAHMVALSYRRR